MDTLLDEIVQSIRESEMIPYEQLTAYLETGNSQYITRRNNAREKIVEIDNAYIKFYLEMYKESLK